MPKLKDEINSSVTDFLPAISHDGNKLAFISKRSGYSKIWLKSMSSTILSSIEPPDEGRSFYSMHWSRDNKRLLANTSKGLVIFDVEKKEVVKKVSLSLPAYGVNWLKNNEIIYSHYQNNLQSSHQSSTWQLFRYSLLDEKSYAFEQRWAFALANEKYTLLIDQAMTPFAINEKNELRELTELNCAAPLYRHTLTMRLDKEDFYCLAQDNPSELIKFNQLKTLTRQAHNMRSMGYYDYAVVGERQALSKTKSANSDIMRTNFQQ